LRRVWRIRLRTLLKRRTNNESEAHSIMNRRPLLFVLGSSVAPLLLTAVVHRHAVSHSSTPTDDYSWLWPWWIVGWLLAIGIAYRRKLKSIWLFVLVGWIMGPIGTLIAAFIKPQEASDVITRSDEDPNVAQWLVLIDSGRLPRITPDGIMPLEGESFFYQQAAQYGQTVAQRIVRGSNPALYVPLGHGFRMRVGGYQGESQQASNFQWGPFGTVMVSSRRIVFKANGSPEVALAPYSQILSYELYPNGLGLQVDRVGMVQFRTGDVVLGRLFKKIVDERLEFPSGAGHEEVRLHP
jgi:hypothetical protein